jgi:hypothetical protein
MYEAGKLQVAAAPFAALAAVGSGLKKNRNSFGIEGLPYSITK